jgi:hypothetical protein
LHLRSKKRLDGNFCTYQKLRILPANSARLPISDACQGHPKSISEGSFLRGVSVLQPEAYSATEQSLRSSLINPNSQSLVVM